MCECAGTLAEGWLEVENQPQERLTLKSWQSGLPSDSQVAQTPSPTHRAPGTPGKRSNLTLSSPTVSTMVCHHLSTFEYLLSPADLVARVNNWLRRSTTYLLFAHEGSETDNLTTWSISMVRDWMYRGVTSVK